MMRPANLTWYVCAAGIVFLAGVGATGLGPHEPECVRAADGLSRPLDLQKADDRAHLQQDLAEVRAAAVDFGDAVSRRPALSDSIDAVAGAKTAPARARVWCAAILTADVLRTHHLQPADLP